MFQQGGRAREQVGTKDVDEEASSSDSDEDEDDYLHGDWDDSTRLDDRESDNDGTYSNHKTREMTGQSSRATMHDRRQGAGQYKTFRTARWMQNGLLKKAKSLKQKMHLTERT